MKQDNEESINTDGSTVDNEVNRVMRNTPSSQTKANPNLIIPITYTSAKLHESMIEISTIDGGQKDVLH